MRLACALAHSGRLKWPTLSSLRLFVVAATRRIIVILLLWYTKKEDFLRCARDNQRSPNRTQRPLGTESAPSLRLPRRNRLRVLPTLQNPSQIFLGTRKMHVFFANPEPLFLVGDCLETHRTDPIHHAHCFGLAEGCFFIASQSRPGAKLKKRESHLRHRHGRNTKRKRLR